MKAKTYLKQAGVSVIFLLIGFVGGYGVFGGWLIADDPWTRGIVADLFVQSVCCIPVLIPASLTVASLVALVQSRFKLENRSIRTINVIASTIIGFIAYLPFEFLLIMGAAL